MAGRHRLVRKAKRNEHGAEAAGKLRDRSLLSVSGRRAFQGVIRRAEVSRLRGQRQRARGAAEPRLCDLRGQRQGVQGLPVRGLLRQRLGARLEGMKKGGKK